MYIWFWVLLLFFKVFKSLWVFIIILFFFLTIGRGASITCRFNEYNIMKHYNFFCTHIIQDDIAVHSHTNTHWYAYYETSTHVYRYFIDLHTFPLLFFLFLFLFYLDFLLKLCKNPWYFLSRRFSLKKYRYIFYGIFFSHLLFLFMWWFLNPLTKCTT